MARSPLTETYKRVEGMVSYVQQNLSGDEYNLFLDMVAPQPDPVHTKKTRKKRTTKSARASGMAAAIRQTLHSQASIGQSGGTSSREAKVEGGNGADLEPAQTGPLCGVCGHGKQYQDHFKPSPNYHPFDAPAQPAEKKSRRKAAAASATQNSEIEKGAAISAGS